MVLAYVAEGLFLQYASLLFYTTKTDIIKDSFAQSRQWIHHADVTSQVTITVLFDGVCFSFISEEGTKSKGTLFIACQKRSHCQLFRSLLEPHFHAIDQPAVFLIINKRILVMTHGV